jgi:hypothetical protein
MMNVPFLGLIVMSKHEFSKLALSKPKRSFPPFSEIIQPDEYFDRPKLTFEGSIENLTDTEGS